MHSIERDPADHSLKINLRLAGRIARGEVKVRDLNLTKAQFRSLQLLVSWLATN